MAIAYTASSYLNLGFTTGATLTQAWDATGSDFIRVDVTNATGGTVTGITFDGANVTLAQIKVQAANFGASEIQTWGAAIPSGSRGSHNIVISITGNINALYAYAMGYNGVNQTTPVGATGSITASGNLYLTPNTDAPVTLTLTNSNSWLCFYVEASDSGKVCAAGTGAAQRGRDGSVGSLDSNAALSSGSQTANYQFTTAGFYVNVVSFELNEQSTGSTATGAGTATVSAAGLSTAVSTGTAGGAATVSGAALGGSVAVGNSAGTSTAAAVRANPTAITINSKPSFPANFITGDKVIVVDLHGGSSVDCPLSGTITGALTSPLEASWQGGGYVTLTNVSVSGGNWTGTLPAQAAGKGAITVRVSGATSVNASSYLEVGDAFLVVGDSTALRGGTSEDLGITTGEHCLLWDGTNWQNHLSTSGGFFWTRLAQQLRAYLGHPVFFVNAASSGTKLESDWLSGQGTYTAAQTLFANSGLVSCRAVLMQLGSNSIAFPTGSSAATYKADIDAFRTSVLTDFNTGYAIHKMVADKGTTAWGGETANYITSSNNIRQGILDYWNEAGGGRAGANVTGQLYVGDNTHPDTTTEGRYLAFEWFIAVQTSVFANGGGRGPKLSIATIDATNKIIDVYFDQTLANTVSSSVGGFRVFDNGVTVNANITSVVVQGSTQVRITLNTAIVGTPTVSFASGEDAVNQTIPTSTTYPLSDTAVQPTITVPAEPFFAQTMSSGVGAGTSAGAAIVNGLMTANPIGTGTSGGAVTALGIALSTARSVGNASSICAVRGRAFGAKAGSAGWQISVTKGTF